MKKEKIKWILVNFPECIAAAAMTAAVLITGLNAITRYTISYTIWGSSEYVSLAFVWVIFPEAAAAYRRGMHFGIDFIVNMLPPKISTYIRLIARVIIFLIMFICMRLSFTLIQEVSTKAMTATRISYVWYDLPAFISFALMMIYTAVFLVRDIRTLAKKDGMENGH